MAFEIHACWIFIVLAASSLKQQSADRYVAPLWHMILIPSQPVFTLSPYCCGEATHTKCMVFGLTPSIYHTPGEHANHYKTDAVHRY
jgi:hypothetical protein